MLGFVLKVWGFSGGTSETAEPEIAESAPLCRTLGYITVEGEAIFVRYIESALSEIDRHGQFVEMVAQLQKIIQVDTFAECGIGFEGVYNCYFDRADVGDTVWRASQIVHEAVHYRRMLAGCFDCSDLVSEELIAFEQQAQFLRDCGRFAQARHVESLDGNHN